MWYDLVCLKLTKVLIHPFIIQAIDALHLLSFKPAEGHHGQDLGFYKTSHYGAEEIFKCQLCGQLITL